MKKAILVSLILLKHPLKALMLSRGQAAEYMSNMLKPAANDLSLTTLLVAAIVNYVSRTNRRFSDGAFSRRCSQSLEQSTHRPQDCYLFNGRFQTSLEDLFFSKGHTTNIDTTLLQLFLLLLSSSLSLSLSSLLASPFDVLRHQSLHVL